MNMQGVDQWSCAQATPNKKVVWSDSLIRRFMEEQKVGKQACGGYGKKACDAVSAAVRKYPVAGKSVLVVGSLTPWVEALLVSRNAARVLP